MQAKNSKALGAQKHLKRIRNLQMFRFCFIFVFFSFCSFKFGLIGQPEKRPPAGDYFIGWSNMYQNGISERLDRIYHIKTLTEIVKYTHFLLIAQNKMYEHSAYNKSKYK